MCRWGLPLKKKDWERDVKTWEWTKEVKYVAQEKLRARKSKHVLIKTTKDQNSSHCELLFEFEQEKAASDFHCQVANCYEQNVTIKRTWYVQKGYLFMTLNSWSVWEKNRKTLEKSGKILENSKKISLSSL